MVGTSISLLIKSPPRKTEKTIFKSNYSSEKRNGLGRKFCIVFIPSPIKFFHSKKDSFGLGFSSQTEVDPNSEFLFYNLYDLK